MSELQVALERWANFYLTMAAAAATLIGLLFVVIALISGGTVKDAADGMAKVRVYLTPTVVYFASVFFVAALLSFPDHTRLTALLSLCLAGVTIVSASVKIL
ncbi:MAG TPA: hypothetical protein VKR56_11450 [Candidatus Cybelea sp.]|nr:hypothetical protein [Candidatus Cybelea sp.]